MSDENTIVGATAALDPAPTDVTYAWGEEPYPDDDTTWREDGWPIRAAYLLIAATIAAVAIAAASIAGMLVLTPRPQPGSHYTIAPSPVQAPIPKAAPPPNAAAPRKASPPPVQAAPPAALAPSAPQPKQPRPPARSVPSHEQGGFTTAEDRWFLQSLEPPGYTFTNPTQVVAWGHHFCRLLQQGESIQAADRDMATLIGADPTQLDSSAQLAYPTCY
jgi:hypothetical protein